MAEMRTLAFVLVCVALSGCTFVNRQAFEVTGYERARANEVMDEVEYVFSELGLRLTRKVEFAYPEVGRRTAYHVGRHENPLFLYSAYDNVYLTLTAAGTLRVEWVRVSDRRERLSPERFDAVNRLVT